MSQYMRKEERKRKRNKKKEKGRGERIAVSRAEKKRNGSRCVKTKRRRSAGRE